ncbi:MAG: hypothetical protein IJU56_08890 [Clostridia bacterium]|nr:hypothetical protein [Clostridia bacterium]
MACFIVPGAEAIVVTAAALILKQREAKKAALPQPTGVPAGSVQSEAKQGFSRKLFWLAGLLWGGVVLLAFEHLWHGEVQPFFPFLTAATEGAGAVAEMLSEMASVGVTMAVLVTAVWAVMLVVSRSIEKRPAAKAEAQA